LLRVDEQYHRKHYRARAVIPHGNLDRDNALYWPVTALWIDAYKHIKRCMQTRRLQIM
jgi:hypothetical protein